MRKSTGPRFFKSKNAWFAEINRQRTRLCDGPKNKETADEAKRLYDVLVKTLAVEVAGDRSPVYAVLDAYLVHCNNRLDPMSPNTWQYQKTIVSKFCRFVYQGRQLGDLQVRELKPLHFQAWIAHGKAAKQAHGKATKQWSENYCVLTLKVLGVAFRWAAGEGDLISESPMARRGKRMKLPQEDLSLKRLAITAEEHAELLAVARRRTKGNFAELLELLYGTGARPAELHQAEAKEWNAELEAFVIDPADPKNIGRLKNRKSLLRRKRKRIVRIPKRLIPTVQRLIAARPEGKLFRTERGRAWPNKSVFVGRRMSGLVKYARKRAIKQKREPVRKGLSLYSYRHAFVTRWLKARKDVPLLADLLNTSITMIQNHYSHLLEDHAGASRDLNEFDGRDISA